MSAATDQDNLASWERQARLEQYKLCVEMADRVSQRRLTANSFFATLATSIIGALAWFGGKANTPSLELALCVLGVVLCWTWRDHITHSQKLNAAKFEVIQKLENSLPSQPYSDEWTIAKTHPKGYVGHSRIEVLLPLVAGVLFAVLLVLRLLKGAGS